MWEAVGIRARTLSEILCAHVCGSLHAHTGVGAPSMAHSAQKVTSIGQRQIENVRSFSELLSFVVWDSPRYPEKQRTNAHDGLLYLRETATKLFIRSQPHNSGGPRLINLLTPPEYMVTPNICSATHARDNSEMLLLMVYVLLYVLALPPSSVFVCSIGRDACIRVS